MKRVAIPVITSLILSALLLSCMTSKPSDLQDEISTDYSMIYDIGFDAFNPIAEEFITPGDKLLIVNIGQGYEGTIGRYNYEPDPEAKPFSFDQFMADRPFFTEYFEKGIIKSVLDHQGRGFERLNLTPYISHYSDWLIENDYIFNTSPLDYSRWDQIKADYNVNKVLTYSIYKAFNEEDEYIGMQIGLKLIDIDNHGVVLHDSVENFTSPKYPNNKMRMLDRFVLDIPEESILDFETKLKDALKSNGITQQLNAVLMKSDDIQTFGNYPLTIEDFILEQSLTSSIGALSSIDILEKLAKRKYKEEWQLSNAVFNVNPYRGGEYSEFKEYYNTPYMLSYKTIWSEQTGEIEDVDSEKIALNGKILGVYLKLIDMNNYGKIVFSYFMPFTSEEELNSNFLYKSFTRVNSLDAIVSDLNEKRVLSKSEKSVIINERMEIFKHHLLSGNSEYETMFNLFTDPKNVKILTEYDKVYKIFNEEKAKETKGDVYYILAVHLMNSWFEEGLSNLLVNNGYQVVDKLESIYSRYLITEMNKTGQENTNIFLSPLLIDDWGSNIKEFYDLENVLYYIPMEKDVENSTFITPNLIAGSSTAGKISQYYPILSYELDRMLISILDLKSGDYLFNKNFDLEGEE